MQSFNRRVVLIFTMLDVSRTCGSEMELPLFGLRPVRKINEIEGISRILTCITAFMQEFVFFFMENLETEII